MVAVKTGKYTYLLENTPSILSFGSVGSKKEAEGPLGKYFDLIDPDSSFGEDTWEKAESRMVQLCAERAMRKGNLEPEQLDVAFGGDLLNQCIGTTYGMPKAEFRLWGCLAPAPPWHKALRCRPCLWTGRLRKKRWRLRRRIFARPNGNFATRWNMAVNVRQPPSGL